MAKLKKSEKSSDHGPDEFQEITGSIWEKIVENPTRSAAIVGGALAAALVVVLLLHLKERSDEKRLAKASAVMERYLKGESGEFDDALVKDMEEIAGDRSVSGGMALYYLGGLRARQGDYAAAAESYLAVKKKYGGNENLANAATLALAFTYRAAGEAEKALALFEELLAAKDAPVPVTAVNYEIGRIHEERGENEKAVERYRSVVETEDPGSSLAEKARKRLEGLAPAA